jgi:CheY-like chemotaxis protein
MASEILIAHSDKADQEEFRRIFETTDYRPVFSDNGEEALLRARLFRPDLIIAGVSLGEKGGLELCEALKADPECQDIPFILLTEIFEEISEKDRLRVGADGIISKPLREGAILNLLDQVIEEKAAKDAHEFLEPKKEEESFLDLDMEKIPPEKDAEFILDEQEEMEEEIIELVDVIEEPEPKMSINDFVGLEKEEPPSDITPLESWGDLFGEEKKPVKPPEKGQKVPVEKAQEKEKGPKRKPLELEKEASSEDDLFEKIELEEILEKVERLKPSLESEWPTEEAKPVEWQVPVEEAPEPVEWQPPPEKEAKPVEWQPPPEEVSERSFFSLRLLEVKK